MVKILEIKPKMQPWLEQKIIGPLIFLYPERLRQIRIYRPPGKSNRGLKKPPPFEKTQMVSKPKCVKKHETTLNFFPIFIKIVLMESSGVHLGVNAFP